MPKDNMSHTNKKYKTLRPCLQPNAKKFNALCYYCPKDMSNNSPKHVQLNKNQDDELTIKDNLLWMLWQCTDRSMTDLTDDPNVMEFVNKTETGLNTLFEQRLNKIVPEKNDKALNDLTNLEGNYARGFNQAIDLIMDNFRKGKE